MHGPGSARAGTLDGAHIRTPSGNSIHSFHVLPNLDAPLRRRPLREKLALHSILDTRCGRTALGLTVVVFTLVAAVVITFATTPLDGTLVSGEVWDDPIFEGRLILTTDGGVGSGIGIGSDGADGEESMISTESPTFFNSTLSPTDFDEDEFEGIGDMLVMTTCEEADISKFVAQPVSAASCLAYFFVSIMMLAFAAADSCWSGVYNIEDSLLLRRPAWSVLLALPMLMLR
jgi:hypothetical protein